MINKTSPKSPFTVASLPNPPLHPCLQREQKAYCNPISFSPPTKALTFS